MFRWGCVLCAFHGKYKKEKMDLLPVIIKITHIGSLLIQEGQLKISISLIGLFLIFFHDFQFRSQEIFNIPYTVK